MHLDITLLDDIPGEKLLEKNLQQELTFSINNKTIKTGKLVLFKRVHYNIIITLNSTRRGIENFEIPIPFKAEYDVKTDSIMFDYSLSSLSFNNNDVEKRLQKLKIKNTTPSQYYNNKLTIKVV